MRLDDADWPLFGWISDVRPALQNARSADRAVVLATLVDVVGSCPRPLGAQMLFDGSRATGYFSGGCVEADIANHAAEVFKSGQARRLVYGDGSPWLDIRLLCGGRIEILLERVEPGDPAVDDLLRLQVRRRQAKWQSDGRRHLVDEALHDGPAFEANGHRYVRNYDPDWRLVVVGGDPVALAIAQLGALSGFTTILARPDHPHGDVPLDGVRYIRGNGSRIVADLKPDRWTAVVSAMHDDEADDGVVIAALSGDAGYVGVLGALKRIPARRERLTSIGMRPEKVNALHAPIGAIRCGKAPWEVAVSTLAEIMQVRAEQQNAAEELRA